LIVKATARGENPPTSSIEDDPRWLLVQRIVASPGFVNSHRLSSFLQYVSKQTLAGEGGSLNERTIGEIVFERSAQYDPRDDNIVRSHASRLRLRLQEYFEAEGAQEELRVNIPRGSYAPVFDKVKTSRFEPEFSDQDAGATLPTAVPRPKASKILLTFLVLLALAVTAASGTLYIRFRSSLQQTPAHKLWSQMFRGDQETIIVPADSSLVIARLLVGHPIPLSEYAGGLYRSANNCNKPCDLGLAHTVESLRYTSMSDLEFAVKVTHLPEAIQNRTEIRYARDLELKDFKDSNLILSGSQEADPWLSSISGQMNFVVHDDPDAGPLRVENKHPKAGEKSEYLYDPHDPQHRGLATVAFLPNISGSGNMLIVQGFSLAGTQAAADFVINGKDLNALLQAYAGNASKLPHFEILLGTMEVNGMASRPVALAWHTYP
jgi:hypothetical protein